MGELICNTLNQQVLQNSLLPRLGTGHAACLTQTLTQQYLLRAATMDSCAKTALSSSVKTLVQVQTMNFGCSSNIESLQHKLEHLKYNHYTYPNVVLCISCKRKHCYEVNSEEMKLPKTLTIEHVLLLKLPLLLQSITNIQLL